jgi:hypothetical protein
MSNPTRYHLAIVKILPNGREVVLHKEPRTLVDHLALEVLQGLKQHQSAVLKRVTLAAVEKELRIAYKGIELKCKKESIKV